MEHAPYKTRKYTHVYFEEGTNVEDVEENHG